MVVLERDAELAALDVCLDAARRGQGRLVWVQGEPGVGKSTLVERFCADVRGARVAVGVCDALDTPRPLGPVLEVGERLGAVDADSEVSRETLLRGVMDALSQAQATVVVIEDAHWADEATLDVLRLVGRRLAGLRALVVVTFRDDELDATHPLRVLVGDLATVPGVGRVELGALTHAAVAALAEAAGSRIDVHDLYAQTGGNPFFVTEVLAGGGATLPPTVRDAVLARAARLSADARAALAAAAAVPGRAETWLVDGLVGAGAAGLDECVEAGMLRADAPGTVAFRHELARRAVDEAVPPARRAELHARAARLLVERRGERADAARVAYHAEQAGDAPLAHEQAARAARRAAELGAHRQAAVQYERALRHAEGVNDAHRAGLLEAYALQCLRIDHMGASLDAATEAATLQRGLGDARRLGRVLRLQGFGLWEAGRCGEATEAVREAISILETFEPSTDLADLYWAAAQLAYFSRDDPSTLAFGEKAIALGRRLEATRTAAGARLFVGSSKIVHGDPRGVEDLRNGIALADEAGLEPLVMFGWAQLGAAAAEVRDYATAEPALRRATAIAEAGDLHLDHHRRWATAWLAQVRLERGDWTEAETLLDDIPLDSPRSSLRNRITAVGVLGRLRVRRGDDGADAALEHARELATRAEMPWRWPVATAQAEAAWLAGDVAAIPALVDEPYAWACERGLAWAAGELGFWRRRAGSREPLPDVAAEPWVLQASGRHADAAACWEELGCPYEAADALADSHEPDELLAALEVFDGLGARPAGARVRRRLRDLGVRAVPRGPRSSTAANPAGLTPRQVEVLELVAMGLSDGDIAARLHLSPKTVGHHVSAILAKLEVASRGEAAHRARELIR